jgi:cell division protease FtsH
MQHRLKVTIVPRGTKSWEQYLPEERLIGADQMLDEMCATMGGRAAEQVTLVEFLPAL